MFNVVDSDCQTRTCDCPWLITSIASDRTIGLVPHFFDRIYFVLRITPYAIAGLVSHLSNVWDSGVGEEVLTCYRED